jgi:DNA-binding SARP family transcriptional activator
MLRVCLFGRLQVRRGAQSLVGIEGDKARELLCYLLLHGDHPQSRESLATLLWPESQPAQAKRNLRQSLWQLQAALQSSGITEGTPPLLRAESDSIWLNPDADVWLDVTVFQQAYTRVRGVRGEDLDPERSAELASAVDLYIGELLEGWYQEWCIQERERLAGVYRAMLDKLMANCTVRGDYDVGLAYGERLLADDPARERIHRRMMRLYYLAGDRTEALRQYERCVAALAAELGVKPSRRTVSLYDQMRADRLDGVSLLLDEIAPSPGARPGSAGSSGALQRILGQLTQLRGALAEIQEQVQRQLQAGDQSVDGQEGSGQLR